MLLEAEMDPGLCYAWLQKDMRSDSYSGTLWPHNLSVRTPGNQHKPSLLTSLLPQIPILGQLKNLIFLPQSKVK